MTEFEEFRKQFEAWTKTFNIPLRLDRDGGGDYVFSDAWYGWKAWQAALASRAESPAGTSLADMFTINEFPCLPDGVVVFSQGGEIKGVMHTIPEKVTTSPERVQIPAESNHVQCPKCPAHTPVGLHCGGPNCPLRK